MRAPAYLALLTAMVASHAAAMAAAGPHSGFTVPKGQPNGVYSVSYDTNGTAIHTLIAEPLTDQEFASHQAAAARAPHARALQSRQSDSTSCGGYGLNPGDTDRANAGLGVQCTPGAVSIGRDFYSIWGSVVSYVCNYGSTGWVCWASDLSADYVRITQTCGNYNAGWRVRWLSGSTGAQSGYEGSGARFCGRGTNG